jgi:hypothetical protein
MRTLLEPHIRDAFAGGRQVLPAGQAVELVYPDGGYGFGVGQAEVYGDAGFAGFFSRCEGAPIGDAAAGGAEVEADGFGAPDVGAGGAGDGYRLIDVAVGPKRAVAAADGAIAGGGICGDAVKRPVDCATVAGAFDH